MAPLVPFITLANGHSRPELSVSKRVLYAVLSWIHVGKERAARVSSRRLLSQFTPATASVHALRPTLFPLPSPPRLLPRMGRRPQRYMAPCHSSRHRRPERTHLIQRIHSAMRSLLRAGDLTFLPPFGASGSAVHPSREARSGIRGGPRCIQTCSIIGCARHPLIFR